MAAAEFVLFVNGGYGVGKSAILEHIGDLLARAGRAFSLMDVDWFHRSWPPAADDPRNVMVEACNMSAVWAGYRVAGPRQLVVCGVIETAGDRQRYEEALSLPVRSIRLEAGTYVTEARLRRRYQDGSGTALQWHLDRYEELAQRLSSAGLDELAINTDKLTPHATAERVLLHFTLLP